MSEPKRAGLADRKQKILSRREVEGMIADGRHVIIFDNRVLKVDAWMKFHPGGEHSIKHMVGRDATDEINALHSKEARERMLSYQVGRVQGRWTNFLPPIQGGHFRPYELTEGSASDNSSETSSRSSSPVFDEPLNDGSTRQRKASVSTAASSAPSTPSGEKTSEWRPSFLDARTQEEIVFDIAKYPSLQPDAQDFITEKYRELGERIAAEGLYDCNYWAYFRESCRYSVLAALSYTFLRIGWYWTSAFFLGFLWQQLVFTVHDAGHMGITHDFQFDSTLGMTIASYIGGLSLCWWKHNHNVHHIVTNAPEHDPDIQHMPFFAISHRFLTSLHSTYYGNIMAFDALAKVVLKYQDYLYYVLLLFGRFNLYVLVWSYFLSNKAPKKGSAWWHKYYEITGQAFFWYWYGYCVVYCSIPDWTNRIMFIVISHLAQSPLHLQITLSHFAMSTADLGVHESFAQKMLRTTMDVDCPPWLDFFHGGLQFQAIHHLYPRIPRHNLRRTQTLVLEFCREVNVPYAIFTFTDGNKEVISRLGEVAKQVRMLEECRKAVSRELGQ
ncbi:delta8-fatty-acid desaturase [Talaromyces islandicus]|uniref:Delta 8-(E)-sphingolipid desaturase n=1 Tax=Talaromyces islandicus TaxID=28573 RepID=A0A0U1M7K2_TALIS|nr:delta8-fatty-acid desaturase [Talaromyces islandicus]